MKTYKAILRGESPLLMHKDNIVWSELVKKWQKDPQNKAFSQPGDDRSPAWTWIGSLYHDGKNLCMDSDNLMTMLREGGAKVPTGRKQQTYKAATQSGLLVNSVDSVFLVEGSRCPLLPSTPSLASSTSTSTLSLPRSSASNFSSSVPRSA